MGRRLFILDAGLCSKHGHHFNTDVAMVKAAVARGMEPVVFGHQACRLDPEVIRALDPVPFFAHSVYEVMSAAVGEVENLGATNERFYQALRNVKRGLVSSEDTLVFHTVHAPNLLGLARWLEELFVQAQPLVVIYLLRNDYIDFESGRRNGRDQIYRRFFEAIAPWSGRRITVLAQSHGQRADLREFSGGAEIGLGPIFRDYELMFSRQALAGPRPQDRLRVGYLGHSSKARKGFGLLPEVIALLHARHAKAEFVVQWDPAGTPAEVTAGVAERLANLPVKWLKGSLSPADYYDNLCHCDLILLPYSPGYNRNGSGILYECLALAKPVVLPAYCNFQEETEPYHAAARFFSEWTAPAITAVTADAIAGLATLRERACVAAPKFFADRSPRAFFDQIWGPACGERVRFQPAMCSAGGS